MDYENFKEQFVEDVRDRLYEQGAEVDLSVHFELREAPMHLKRCRV